jgi:isoleucyl-tRNA synthetase
MGLTKELTEAATPFGQRKDTAMGLSGIELHHCAAVSLVKMVAPITPAFADHCWSMLKQPAATSPRSWLWKTMLGPSGIVSASPRPSLGERTAADCRFPKAESVHDQPFPELDGTFDMLAPSTQPCAVQINGKLKVSDPANISFAHSHTLESKL